MESQTNTPGFLHSLNQKIEKAVAYYVRLKERLTSPFQRRSSAQDIETGGVEVSPPSPPSNKFSGILITLCFTSAMETLLLFLQLQEQKKNDHRHFQYFPVSFNLFSLAITCAFATTFVQKFVVGPNSTRLSDLLNKIGKGFFAAAFFLAIIIPSPVWLRIIYAAIFFVTLVAVSIA